MGPMEYLILLDMPTFFSSLPVFPLQDAPVLFHGVHGITLMDADLNSWTQSRRISKLDHPKYPETFVYFVN